MKRDINKKINKNNMISKLISFLFLFVIVFSPLNAVTLSLDQTDNLYELSNKETGNSIIQSIAGNIDLSMTQPVNSSGNFNYTYDYVLELNKATQEFYLVLENFYVNSTYTLYYRGDLNKNPTLYVKELTLNEQGNYIFKFTPSDEEPVKIYIDKNDPLGVFNIYYTEEKPRGFSSLISGFISTFEKVFDINIKLWFLLYYIIIIVLTLSFIGLIFGISFYLIDKTKQIKNKESFFSITDNEKNIKDSEK